MYLLAHTLREQDSPQHFATPNMPFDMPQLDRLGDLAMLETTDSNTTKHIAFIPLFPKISGVCIHRRRAVIKPSQRGLPNPMESKLDSVHELLLVDKLGLFACRFFISYEADSAAIKMETDAVQTMASAAQGTFQDAAFRYP
ncbi:uncharacterized protein GLRG_02060 [Colletotrichum graminicola M1.001]|uniref:Uncharacterized protein n=1 Tax=Colletotrichum graminicola (strain M1.001 / M2 / FGSC 10212) TaxID=645133 RepID=E3Q8L8_COLGM|nr:uncharacterized protein GLRG_02060 [Colletotrichum graminicola M1.001]EFQ26889.1 hypothetical protein GLRG_02060 [Colletotrichum graminicola M1.001]